MSEEEETSAKKALAALITPLARLMIDTDMSLQDGIELLKVALVESATDINPNASASHLSLMTGVHRKDIRRLERNDLTPKKSTAAARVLSLWQNDPDFTVSGKPKPLSRAGDYGFDALVSRSKVDGAPATLLSILLESGNVVERNGLFHFVSASIVPEDKEEKLKVAVATLKPHLDTAVGNLLGQEPQWDQALRYSHLTQGAAKQLEQEAARLALEMLEELGSLAHKLQQDEEGSTLFVAGTFTHITEHDK